MKAHRLIHWPAVIHFTGHAELAYVGSQAQWDADGHLHASGYRPADRLIDSSGRIWSLGRGHPHAIPQFSGETASLDTLIALVRAHGLHWSGHTLRNQANVVSPNSPPPLSRKLYAWWNRWMRSRSAIK